MIRKIKLSMLYLTIIFFLFGLSCTIDETKLISQSNEELLYDDMSKINSKNKKAEIEISSTHCCTLCTTPPSGCIYIDQVLCGPCDKVTCGILFCKCRSGQTKSELCTTHNGLAGFRSAKCVNGYWKYGPCQRITTKPKCGPGELLCARTNKCYPKWDPTLCWECIKDKDCPGGSAKCRNHRCIYY